MLNSSLDRRLRNLERGEKGVEQLTLAAWLVVCLPSNDDGRAATEAERRLNDNLRQLGLQSSN
jgi:hypothetical protein